VDFKINLLTTVTSVAKNKAGNLATREDEDVIA